VRYASTHGQTEKIALRLCDVLRAEGLSATPNEAGAGEQPLPTSYDAVIVGASVHAGHHQREVVAWAESHAGALNLMPSAFFSVSLSQADHTEESRAANRGYLDDFAEKTGWDPDETVALAGALQYLEYDFMTKLVMRLMMRRDHHPTDTSQDYEYTDWDAVEVFGRKCAAMALATSAVSGGRP
jgi:menaquinone-dependent protoporphyrinogen oxidase